MNIESKLSILADAAKYDASCASSGGAKRSSRDGKGLGSTTGCGICHAYTPDGRCVSLLKILLTNFCIFDCVYCVNRSSSNVPRARFTTREIVDLTIGFYRRNMIEGLFPSSGIIRDADYTMGEIVAAARALRLDHQFRGYIHLKTIPGAAPELIEEAGRHADQLSVNIELPSDDSVRRLAPQKSPSSIRVAMAAVRTRIEDAADARPRYRSAPRFAPAGQSTQMIVGADTANDAAIIGRSAALYGSYGLKRVYYSAFSPIPDSSSKLPVQPPPLVREHRLYQADWLMRFYGFRSEEIFDGAPDGMLDLALDPKHVWALRHRAEFPVDVNTAAREQLLRVPGLGVKVVDRILSTRRHGLLRFGDLARLCRSASRVAPFVTALDWHPRGDLDVGAGRFRAVRPAERAPQLDLFG